MNYDSWASALAKFWLTEQASGPIVLALEPHILIDVAATVNVTFSSAEMAVESFVEAVRTYQRTLRSRPWRVESIGGNPRFLLLIAIQVYAASQMDDDQGHHTRNAYYIQLENLVGNQAMSSNFAADHGKAHRKLWRAMKNWLNEHGRTINLPSDAAGTHERNVGLPKSQALLRLGDLAELPLFFRLCRYQSDKKYFLERVENDLLRWKDDCRAFPSAWARSVLSNSLKFPSACRQVHKELKLWDGQWEIVDAGRRQRHSASRVKVWFGINRKKAQLISRIVHSDDKSELLSVESLANALAGKPIAENASIALQRGLCLCRYDVDDGAFKQVSAVEPGDRCLFAASREVAGAVELVQHLVAVSQIASGVRWYWEEADEDDLIVLLTGIPSSCALVEFQVTDPLPYHERVDHDWHPFLKSPASNLIPSGGLRFGRDWNWVAGAGPSIRIVGNRLPKSIAIDALEVPVSGRIVSHPNLSEFGEHVVSGTIDGQPRQCVFSVSDPVEPEFTEPPGRAWAFEKTAAEWKELSDDETFLHGMRLSKSTTEASLSLPEEQRTAIRLLAGYPLEPANRPARMYNHPLTRSLLKVSKTRDCG